MQSGNSCPILMGTTTADLLGDCDQCSCEQSGSVSHTGGCGSVTQRGNLNFISSFNLHTTATLSSLSMEDLQTSLQTVCHPWLTASCRQRTNCPPHLIGTVAQPNCSCIMYHHMSVYDAGQFRKQLPSCPCGHAQTSAQAYISDTRQSFDSCFSQHCIQLQLEKACCQPTPFKEETTHNKCPTNGSRVMRGLPWLLCKYLSHFSITKVSRLHGSLHQATCMCFIGGQLTQEMQAK